MKEEPTGPRAETASEEERRTEELDLMRFAGWLCGRLLIPMDAKRMLAIVREFMEELHADTEH